MGQPRPLYTTVVKPATVVIWRWVAPIRLGRLRLLLRLQRLPTSTVCIVTVINATDRGRTSIPGPARFFSMPISTALRPRRIPLPAFVGHWSVHRDCSYKLVSFGRRGLCPSRSTCRPVVSLSGQFYLFSVRSVYRGVASLFGASCLPDRLFHSEHDCVLFRDYASPLGCASGLLNAGNRNISLWTSVFHLLSVKHYLSLSTEAPDSST